MFTELGGHLVTGGAGKPVFGDRAGSEPGAGPEFGPMLRMLRTDKGYRLREFARQVGISAAYLSQIERGEVRPPREDRVRTIAAVLGEDPEKLMAHSGRVSALLSQAIQHAPEDITRLIRLTLSMDREQVTELVEMARRLSRS